MKAVVDAPAWRLAQALAVLTTPDGNTIQVPGYYDAIRPPTLEEQRLVNGWVKRSAASEAAMRQALGVERYIDGLSGRDLAARHLFSTTLNINGMWTGYTGEGMKTILPHVAHARLDSRLVPNQTPDGQLELIRKHLAAKGFGDIKNPQALRVLARADVGRHADRPGGDRRVQQAWRDTRGCAAAGRQRAVLRLYGASGAADGDGRARTRHRRARAERIHGDRADARARALRVWRTSRSSTSTFCTPLPGCAEEAERRLGTVATIRGWFLPR